jgi:phage shock protein PspC (stress-responsive transcriptional regulator)
MYRSFTDRVLGGVCGGLGALFPVNSWWFRGVFVALALLTLGGFAALYLLLWLALPQESLLNRRRGGAGGLLLVLVLVVGTLAAWLVSATGGLRGPGGEGLFWPGMALAVSFVFFLRQLRG